MRTRATRRIAIAALVGVAIGAIVSGCSRETRHEVLTFFFTGVPPLEGEEEGVVGEAAAPAPSRLTGRELRRQRQAALRQQRLEREKHLPWSHGPVAAGDCDSCHATAGSQGFRPPGTGAGVPALADVTPGRLLVPIDDLCVQCHVGKAMESVEERGLVLHDAIFVGGCVGCHNPHRSARQYMLLEANNAALCGQCHDLADLEQRAPLHEGAAELNCVDCHNPHMGQTATMLKFDFDELELP